MPHAAPAILRRLLVLASAALVGCGTSAEWQPHSAARPTRAAVLRTGGEAGAAPGFRQERFAELALPGPTPARGPDGSPGPAYWQNRADYDIGARLNPSDRSIEGSLILHYTNRSPHELAYLWFDLPQNAFRTGSRAERVRPPTDRFDAPHGADLGFEIGSVRHGELELARLVDDTRMRVDLPEPLPPGGSVEIGVDFRFRVPFPGGQRMGILETEAGEVIWQVAQWFPQAARFDDVRGWNTLPYLGFGEFYSDVGDYTVRLSVPSGWVVAATGELENAEEVLTGPQRRALARALASDEPVVVRAEQEAASGVLPAGETTWRFRASDVRTFAFAASPSYAWEAVGARADDGEGERRVLCSSLYPPSVAELWRGSSAMVKHAVEFYSSFFGLAYPYPQMSNAYGVEYGMEYPMVLFCRVEPEDEDPHDGRTPLEDLFGVIDHEAGHAWFPMIVGSDERRHPWMDEGINTFANLYSWRAWTELPGGGVREGYSPVRLREFAEEIADEMRIGRTPPIMTPPDRVSEWEAVGFLAYDKPACGLVLLREHILGPERFDDALRRFVRAWAFASPQPADFFRAMENASGEDLSWFWRGWFAGTGTIDLAVLRVTSGRAEATCVFGDLGGMPMPVAYRVTYSDGTTEDRSLPVEAWHAADTFAASWETGGRRVRRVEIDPDGVLPDVNRSNNVWEAR